MKNRREHFGACSVLFSNPHGPLWSWRGSYPTMEGAIGNLDPFRYTYHVPISKVAAELALAELPGGTMAIGGRY